MSQQILSLNIESGFDKILSHYNKNKEKPWDSWLKVDKIFPKPGKQGLVGIMVSKEDSTISYVFKISQYINYLTHHELSVMTSLNELGDFCPHFCRSVGYISCQVDPTKKKEGNPFIISEDTKYPIEKEVLLMENLNNTYKFLNYINTEKIPENVLYSTIKQVLASICISQRKKQFTHYDLHSNNIMMKKCNRDLVILYVIDEGTQFCVPTYGHYPVIIDFGFSYCDGLKDSPLWPSLNHTDVGFFSDRFDKHADPKLFIVTVSDEINETRRTKKSRKLLNIAKNQYGNLKIDFDSAWDNDTEECATDSVIDKIEKISKKSSLFKNYEYYVMDIIQTLIIIPLEKQDYSNINISYKTFLNEFIKIEKEISSPFYLLYILRGIVDSARAIRSDYSSKITRAQAVGYFKHAVMERIDSVSKFCNLKDIHYEKLLCSLLCFSKCMEGILFETMEKRVKGKDKQYESIPLKTTEELLSVLYINIEDDYVFNENTTILIVDCIKNKAMYTTINLEDTKDINNYASISKGAELYKKIYLLQ
jgi:hypothetical protein